MAFGRASGDCCPYTGTGSSNIMGIMVVVRKLLCNEDNVVGLKIMRQSYQ